MATLRHPKIKTFLLWLWYLRVVLKHELVSGQEVLFREQLHVLTDVLHVLDGVGLQGHKNAESIQHTHGCRFDCHG